MQNIRVLWKYFSYLSVLNFPHPWNIFQSKHVEKYCSFFGPSGPSDEPKQRFFFQMLFLGTRMVEPHGIVLAHTQYKSLHHLLSFLYFLAYALSGEGSHATCWLSDWFITLAMLFHTTDNNTESENLFHPLRGCSGYKMLQQLLENVGRCSN